MIPIETLNQWAQSWAEFMGYRLLDSTIVLMIVGSLWFLLRRRVSAQLGYCLFLLVLLKLIVPSPISLPNLVDNMIPQNAITHSFERLDSEAERFAFWRTREKTTEKRLDSSSAAPAVIDRDKAPVKEISQKPNLSALATLMLGWAAIVLLLTARFAWYQLNTRRKLHEADPLDVSSAPVDLAQLQQIAGVKRPVRWLTCSWANAPVVWGVFRPAIVVPSDLFTSFSKNQIRWILLHELAHIRRGDNVVSMIQGILQIIFFFNPAVWIANILIDQQREYACDDVALAGCDVPRTECGEGFLSIVQRADSLPTFMATPLGLLNRNTLIRRRMMRILDTKRKLRIGLSASSAAFLLAVALLILPSVRAEDTRISENPTLALAETEGKTQSASKEPTPGMTLRRVGSYERTWAAISPDGRHLCESTYEGALIARELVSGESQVLVPKVHSDDHARYPVVSPESKTVAFQRHDGEKNTDSLEIVRLDGSGRRVVRAGESGEYILPKDWSPDGKQLLALRIMKEKKGQFVWVSTEDGSLRTVMTLPKGRLVFWGGSVDLSPDGQYIAYEVYYPHTDGSLAHDIFLFAIDENRETALEHPADDKLLGWTPDGKGILFASDRSGTRDIWLLRVSDGKPQGWPQLIYQGMEVDRVIGFAQNGAYYYGGGYSFGDLYTVGVDLTTGEVLSPPEPVHHGLWGCPAWSPDGQHLAYSPSDSWPPTATIHIWSLATGEERVLDLDFPGWIRCLVWSPDGRFLVASHVVTWTSVPTVYKVDPETGQSNLLIQIDAGRIERAELSPDGKSLVYSGRQPDGDRLLIRDLETGQEKRIFTFHKAPYWGSWDLSPDGTRLAIADNGPASKLKIISVGGEELRELLPEKWDTPMQVAWVPDGQSVLFAMQKDFWHFELWQVSAAGAEPRKIFTTPKLGCWRETFCVHPDGRRIAFPVAGFEPELWVMENFLPTE